MANVVTRKGQVTIPKPVREHLGIVPGTQVEFELAPDGKVVLQPKGSARRNRKSPIARIRGRATVKLTTDEIMALTRGEA